MKKLRKTFIPAPLQAALSCYWRWRWLRVLQVPVERLHHSLLLRLSREAVSRAFHEDEVMKDEHLVKLVSIYDRDSLILAAVDREDSSSPVLVLGRLRGATHVLS